MRLEWSCSQSFITSYESTWAVSDRASESKVFSSIFAVSDGVADKPSVISLTPMTFSGIFSWISVFSHPNILQANSFSQKLTTKIL